MTRLSLASIALLAGCAAPPDEEDAPDMTVSVAGGDVLRPSGDSFNVHVGRNRGGSWTVTVGYGGQVAEEPRILLDGRKVELKTGALSGFGQYVEVEYILEKPGAYRVELWDKPTDELPRAAYAFTLRHAK